MLDKLVVMGNTRLAVLELSHVILCCFALLLKGNLLSEKKFRLKFPFIFSMISSPHFLFTMRIEVPG